MAIRGWRAWYADGSVRDSTQGAWNALPASGLQVVMLYDVRDAEPGLPYRRVMMGDDFYYAAVGGGRDASGFDQTSDPAKASRERLPGSLKQGSQIPDGDFQRIVDDAVAWTTLPGQPRPTPPPVDPPQSTEPKGLLATAVDWVKGLFA